MYNDFIYIKYMVDFIADKVLGPIIILVLILGFASIPFSFHLFYKSAEELQVILKNECGMDYSVDEVMRNGENLSRICGLKNDE